MPWVSQWVPPALLLEHAGTKVYHVYKDDDFANGPMLYWYTLDEEGDPEAAFDVRELPLFPGEPKYSEYLGDGAKLDCGVWDSEHGVRLDATTRAAWEAELFARIEATIRAAIDSGRLRMDNVA